MLKEDVKGWKMIKQAWGMENRKNLTRENKYQGHVVLTQQTAELLQSQGDISDSPPLIWSWPKRPVFDEMFICLQSAPFKSPNQLKYSKPYLIHLPLEIGIYVVFCLFPISLFKPLTKSVDVRQFTIVNIFKWLFVQYCIWTWQYGQLCDLVKVRERGCRRLCEAVYWHCGALS